MPETVLPLAQKAAQLLGDRGVENARLEAELLLAHVLGIKRLELYLQFERPLRESELAQYRTVIRRRLKREPLQYITGKVQFRHLELGVDRRVLIPRPETEVLVGLVLDYAKSQDRALRAIDIGTGSGAIALSLAKEAHNITVVATDVSADAVDVARMNAGENGITIEILIGDLWDAVPADEMFDIVVSNPPYIAKHERNTLQFEVREWEPAHALFAGDDGLSVIRALSGSHSRMFAGALLALEIGSAQAAAVVSLLDDTNQYNAVRIHKDLSGRDRIITAVKRDSV